MLDDHGWSPLHHAADASSYSWRAMSAALRLVHKTPMWVINSQTTGSQPRGWSVMHLACDGSDRDERRVQLVRLLWHHKADLELTTANNKNTPLLEAAAKGTTDIASLLMWAGADKHVVNNRGGGIYQVSRRSSTDTWKNVVQKHHVPRPESWGESRRQWAAPSQARCERRMVFGITKKEPWNEEWHPNQEWHPQPKRSRGWY